MDLDRPKSLRSLIRNSQTWLVTKETGTAKRGRGSIPWVCCPSGRGRDFLWTKQAAETGRGRVAGPGRRRPSSGMPGTALPRSPRFSTVVQAHTWHVRTIKFSTFSSTFTGHPGSLFTLPVVFIVLWNTSRANGRDPLISLEELLAFLLRLCFQSLLHSKL